MGGVHLNLNVPPWFLQGETGRPGMPGEKGDIGAVVGHRHTQTQKRTRHSNPANKHIQTQIRKQMHPNTGTNKKMHPNTRAQIKRIQKQIHK